MIARHRFVIVFGLIVVLLTGCVYTSKLPPLAVKEPLLNAMVIKNVDIFTGDPDQDILTQQNILIKGNNIVKIGQFPIPQTIRKIIDGQGKMVIPGLIDHHIHIYGTGAPPWFPAIPNQKLIERNLSSYLYAGVTTVFDFGGPLFDLEKLKSDIQSQHHLDPRFLYAGKQLTQKGGHPDWMLREVIPWPFGGIVAHKMLYFIHEKKDIKPAVMENKSHGSSMTKIMVDQLPYGVQSLQEDLITQIVKTSNQAGLMVGAHIGSESDLLTVMHSGVNFLAHIPYRSSVSDSTIQAMKEHQAVIIPTLVVFENSADYFNNKLVFTDLDKQIIDPAFKNAYEHVPEDELRTDDPQIKAWVHDLLINRDIKFENVRKMKQAGITIIAGTDSSNLATIAGSSMHTEMRLLVEKCGFTPKEAVAAATSVSGKMIERLTGQKGIGRIEAGSPADLVILNQDFTNDIRQTENIHMVISNGYIVDRQKLLTD